MLERHAVKFSKLSGVSWRHRMNLASASVLMITQIGFPPVKWTDRRIDQHRRQIELLRQAGCVESAKAAANQAQLGLRQGTNQRREFCHGGGRAVLHKRHVNPVRHASAVTVGHRLTGLTGLWRAQKSVKIQDMKISAHDSISAQRRRVREGTKPGMENEARRAADQ